MFQAGLRGSPGELLSIKPGHNSSGQAGFESFLAVYCKMVYKPCQVIVV